MGNFRSRYRYLPILIVLMGAMTLFIGGLARTYVENRLMAMVGGALAIAAEEVAGKMQAVLGERYTDLTLMSRLLGSGLIERAQLPEYLAEVQQTNRDCYLWLAVTDAEGVIVAASDPAAVGESRRNKRWFQTVRDDRTMVVEDVEPSDEARGMETLAMTAPILAPDGTFLGAITARVGLTQLEEHVVRTLERVETRTSDGRKLEYEVLNREGRAFIDSDIFHKGGVNLRRLGLPSALRSEAGRSGSVEEMHLRRHVPMISGYARLDEGWAGRQLGWAVLVRVDRDELFSPLHAVMNNLLILGCVVLVPMFAVLLWSTRRLHQEWEHAQRERKKAMESEERTRLIVEHAMDAIITIDADGRICEWNPQAESTFGWRRDEALDLKLVETIIPVQLREAHERGLKRFLAVGEGLIANKRLELMALHKSGREFPVELSITPVHADGRFRFNGFLRDITERKKAEADLHKAKEAAEAGNRAKSEFLASMSHEIRTPMNAILGMADLLEESAVTDDQRRCTQTLKQAGEALLTLINDILDLSKVEAGHLELERLEFNLEELVAATIEIMAIRAHAKGLELVCEICQGVPGLVVGDPNRLRQILMNLLGNAIKFTAEGEVVLKLEVMSGRNGDAGSQVQGSTDAGSVTDTWVHCSVRDTGIGIPPDKLETIFERFTQVDASTTREYGGSGLGLNICKRLTELMGGRVWVESTLGLGSLFHFCVPFGVPVPQAGPLFQQSGIKSKRVLVIDDNATNRAILHRWLDRMDAIVGEAAGGEEGIRELREAKKAGRGYDVVLLDCRMPGMDGFQVAEALQSSPELSDALVLMLTSENQPTDVARCRNLGIAKYLVKPVKRRELMDTLSASLAVRSMPQSETAVNGSPVPAAGLRVLIVDDSVLNQAVMQKYLARTSCDVETASDGATAVDMIQNGRYDLVFMDMNMPVMDGYTATSRIRAWEREQGREATPIVAVTASAFEEDRKRCLLVGCTAYLSKPVKKQAVLDAIAAYAQERPPVLGSS